MATHSIALHHRQRLARPAQGMGMGYHQTLRWVLTDSEAARLAFDSDELQRAWTRTTPWFVRWWAGLPAQRETGRCA